MSRSLSWIDGDELASSLTRAGVSSLPGESLSRVRFPTARPTAVPLAAPRQETTPARRIDEPLPAPQHDVTQVRHRDERSAQDDQAPTPSTAVRAGIQASRPADVEPTTVRREPVRRAPVGASASPKEDALPPSPPLDDVAVSARIAALEGWLKKAVGPRFYIADPQGLPIAVAPQVKELVVSSVALERAVRSLRGITGTPSPGAVAIALDDERTLETLWCDTKIGRVAIGILGAEPIPKRTAKQIRDNVARTFDWKES